MVRDGRRRVLSATVFTSGPAKGRVLSVGFDMPDHSQILKVSPEPPSPPLRLAEFFAGMGLVRRGFEEAFGPAGATTVYANDISAPKAALYRADFGDGALDARDIHEVRAEDVPRADVWTASFPCTDLSLAGRGAGIHAGQSRAVWGLIELLTRKRESDRPAHVLFENVLGLLTNHGGADLRALVGAMNGLGYGVDPLLVNASSFTAQSRPRLFLIASRDRAELRVDLEVLEPCSARPTRVVAAMRAAPDLVWHARELPGLPRTAQRLESVVERLSEDHEAWWSPERTAYFFAQVHPAHRALVDRMERAPGVSYGAAFRRIRPVGEGGAKRSVIEVRSDGLAGCLRTPKGGSARQMLVEAGCGRRRVRYLLASECARLQGFELSPRLREGFGETALLFALGDAVCVPAVAWVAARMFERTPARPGRAFATTGA